MIGHHRGHPQQPSRIVAVSEISKKLDKFVDFGDTIGPQIRTLRSISCRRPPSMALVAGRPQASDMQAFCMALHRLSWQLQAVLTMECIILRSERAPFSPCDSEQISPSLAIIERSNTAALRSRNHSYSRRHAVSLSVRICTINGWKPIFAGCVSEDSIPRGKAL